MIWPDLSSALGEVPWAVAGAVATRHYMPERMTGDLDALIAVSDGPTARDRLRAAGYVYLGELSIGGSSWQTTGQAGTHVDVLECHAAWCREAIGDAAGNRDIQGLPILPLPYLVVMKLQASRVQDVGDLARMLGQATPETLQQVRDVVRQLAPADVDDLESLISLGRLEMMDQRAGSDRPGEDAVG